MSTNLTNTISSTSTAITVEAWSLIGADGVVGEFCRYDAAASQTFRVADFMCPLTAERAARAYAADLGPWYQPEILWRG